MRARGGLVVCGGKSRRMGQPKALLPFGPERLLQRVVRLVGSVVDQVVVVAAAGQELPGLPDTVLVVRDPEPERGPLQGLAAGLGALPEAVNLVYLTATDAPFLQVAWVEVLMDLIGAADLAIPEVDGHLQPLAALYRRGPILAASRRLLAEGRSRLVDLVPVVRSRVVSAAELSRADPSFLTLRNLNTPDDYRQALSDSGFAAESSPPAPEPPACFRR